MLYRFLPIAVFCILYACWPTRFVKPLARKQQAINLSLGGALIKKGNTTIPIPFLTATYGNGLDSNITLFGTLNVTSALFGNFQTELGSTFQLLKQHSYFPAVSITPVINIIYRNTDAYKIYPQVDVNAYWDYNTRKNYFYAGICNWFELARKQAEDLTKTKRWIFSPLVGHSFTAANWNFITEIKIIAPNLSNEKNVVEYQTPFKTHGAFGIYAGYTYKF